MIVVVVPFWVAAAVGERGGRIARRDALARTVLRACVRRVAGCDALARVWVWLCVGIRGFSKTYF